MHFVCVQNGHVLMWKFNSTQNSFEFWKAVSSHNKAVVTLVVASGRFYTGSMDKTIKVSWISFVFCSLLFDNTIKLINLNLIVV